MTQRDMLSYRADIRNSHRLGTNSFQAVTHRHIARSCVTTDAAFVSVACVASVSTRFDQSEIRCDRMYSHFSQ